MSRLFEKFNNEMDFFLQNEPLFNIEEWIKKKTTTPFFTREFETVVNNIATTISVHFDKDGYPIEAQFHSEKYESEEEKLIKKLENELQLAIEKKIFLKAHKLHLEIETLKKKSDSSK